MRYVQRLSALVGWLSLTAVGTLMIVESAGVIDDRWRRSVSDVIAWLAAPTVDHWVAALLGGLLAILAVVLVLAQVVPVRRVVEGITIDGTETGSTEVTASTLYRRIGYELSQIDDVHAVKPIPDPKRVKFRMELTDSGNVTETADTARAALGAEFWASLGMEPRPVDLVLTYRRGPTPVSRKEQLV